MSLIELWQKDRDSSPIKRYCKSACFPWVSSNHFFTFVAKRFALTSYWRAVTTFAKQLSSGTSENVFCDGSMFDFPMDCFKRALKKYCQASFVKCSGSTWALSMSFPTRGVNSCPLFWRAMNSVTSDLFALADPGFLVFRKLVHAYTRSARIISTSGTIRCTSNTSSTSFLLFLLLRHICMLV